MCRELGEGIWELCILVSLSVFKMQSFFKTTGRAGREGES